MKHYPYLIIGGGMSAAAAMQGIRDVDAEGEIGLITAEQYQPYDRPPLTKGLWLGDATISDIWRNVPQRATLHPGRTVTALDLDAHVAHDDLGNAYRYDKLLLATGGSPRLLPFGGDEIIYYRDVATYHRLRELAEHYNRFAVIGGGFIGSEIAAALATQGKDVTMLFPEEGIGARMFPPDLSAYLNEYYRERGVTVRNGASATELEGNGTDLTLITDNENRLNVNGIVAGIGIEPNVTLAEAAGLQVDDGVIVDELLRTSHEDVFAAGDVANFPDPVTQSRRRVEHEDAANSMGKAAGRNMAGAGERYDHSPMFYSDLFDLGYEAVGALDSRLEMVSDWQDGFAKGVVYYLDADRVRGVLLWNVWGKVDAARELIASGEAVSPEALRGRL